MAGSSFGTIFRITTWGESHGQAIGVVIDGCPAGVPLSQEDIQRDLDRRKPGQSRFTTKRQEEDQAVILSGVFEGKTTGTPISVAVFNQDQRSRDYSEIASCYRPGHGDYTFDAKYGFRDYRGGGRSSGRETIGRVAAGAVAAAVLKEMGIRVSAWTEEIAGIKAETFDPEEIGRNPFYMPDGAAAARVEQELNRIMEQKDSAGGVIRCAVEGMVPGAGDPVFEKLDANLAKALMSIGAVKGVEIGDGFRAARSLGSQNNDSFCAGDKGIEKKTNHAGGILGGISDGSRILLRAAIKPTPSIGAVQATVGRDGNEREIAIKGRHDPVIVPRAVVVVEAMTAITVLDALMCGACSRIDQLKGAYKR